MAQWFLLRNGAEEGPFDDMQLRKLAIEGVLSPGDIVRRDGSATGGPAKKIKGLFTLPTSEKSVTVKRPPPPPSRLGVGVTTTARPSTVSQMAPVAPPPIPATPSQNGAPVPVAQDRRLNPNITFILGIWVAIGLCAAAFTFLAITGRLTPLVAWLEAAAKKEETQQELEQPKQESSPAPRKGSQDEATREADAREAPPSEPGTLTTDFYPYRGGTKQQWDVHIFLPNGGEEFKSFQHSYVGSGIVRSLITRYVGKAGDKAIDMLRMLPKANEPRDEHYRQRAGFVETAHDEKDPDKMIWRPLVKLGAKPGDEWHEPNGFEKFKLLRLEERQLNIKGLVTTDDVLVAVIEESTTGSLAEHELAFGIGPIGLKYWLINDGKKTLSAFHTLIAMSDKTGTGGSSVSAPPTGKPARNEPIDLAKGRLGVGEFIENLKRVENLKMQTPREGRSIEGTPFEFLKEIVGGTCRLHVGDRQRYGQKVSAIFADHQGEVAAIILSAPISVKQLAGRDPDLRSLHGFMKNMLPDADIQALVEAKSALVMFGKKGVNEAYGKAVLDLTYDHESDQLRALIYIQP